jgi:hypothetical protein
VLRLPNPNGLRPRGGGSPSPIVPIQYSNMPILYDKFLCITSGCTYIIFYRAYKAVPVIFWWCVASKLVAFQPLLMFSYVSEWSPCGPYGHGISSLQKSQLPLHRTAHYIRKVESSCEVCDRYQGKGMSTDNRHYNLYFCLHIDEPIGVCITTCVLCLHHYLCVVSASLHAIVHLPCHHAVSKQLHMTHCLWPTELAIYSEVTLSVSMNITKVCPCLIVEDVGCSPKAYLGK